MRHLKETQEVAVKAGELSPLMAAVKDLRQTSIDIRGLVDRAVQTPEGEVVIIAVPAPLFFQIRAALVGGIDAIAPFHELIDILQDVNKAKGDPVPMSVAEQARAREAKNAAT